MRFSNEEAIRQIDEVLKDIEDNFENSYEFSEGGNLKISNKNLSWHNLVKMNIKDCIIRLTRQNSHFREQYDKIDSEKISDIRKITCLLGILKSLKRVYENNYLKTFEEEINSNQFSDYLEMAEYLLNDKKKLREPAAVLIGGVLEENLRNLCRKNNISITTTKKDETIEPKKANKLNEDLKKADIYNEGLKKQIDAWYAIRNSAAHGKHNEYDEKQVRLMLDGVRNFVNDYPA